MKTSEIKDKIEKNLKALDQHCRTDRDNIIVCLILIHGLTPKEVSCLDRRDVLVDEGNQQYTVSKNLKISQSRRFSGRSATRVLPVSMVLKTALEDWLELELKDASNTKGDFLKLPLLQSQRRHPKSKKLVALSPDAISNLFHKLATEAGLTGFTASKARTDAIQSFAEQFENISDETIKMVAEFAGHLDERQTRRLLEKLKRNEQVQ